MSTEIQHPPQITGYINAGGRGTRLNGLFSPDATYGIAKALLEIGEPPIALLDHHIGLMGRLALSRIIVGSGDLQVVSQYVVNKYAHRADIHTAPTSFQFGTAGDIIMTMHDEPGMFGDHVLIKNVDTILEIDDQQFVDHHLSSGVAVTIALTQAKGVPNEGAFLVDKDGEVLYSSEVEQNRISNRKALKRAYASGSSTGALVIDTAFLRDYGWEPGLGQLSLYRNVMQTALLENAVSAFDNGNNFFRDVGTVAMWRDSEQTGVLQPHLCYDVKVDAMDFNGGVS